MRLKELYKKEIVPKMKEKFGYKNDLAVPRLIKVTVNVGFGRQAKEKQFITNVEKSLVKITGQKPVLTKAKKSISSFKVREGMIIGAMATLRGQRMYDFTEKLVNISFPRVRDFRGINEKSVDKAGNLSVGFKEHLAFPEIKADDVENIHGLEICLSTTAKTQEEGAELFKLMGFPFKK
ncbi:50S ribosomal protein L5 [Candidatus Falkowbacteria bacterium CG11_big_fil_rev_8_21_14_0_20_39_10]|uniref:Large ribosomal subunit protein uL5 n=1 Tax=Candidatus Falkowbacteria bacterium CG11_big_fil_rev_8_21_14_0_20_39_10 TaxID=1974570 RepID=A0A2M6K9F0_9BACT|nr:MAG: 50S ribosomal protein L5 [Candidatus Falkowbacteria bacterium CG11_big_fil_rev_8_21_14_0_20_39_10]